MGRVIAGDKEVASLSFDAVAHWAGANLELVLPLLVSVVIAVGDVRTRRIPNYLTLGTALAGLGFQWGFHGWPGLGQGILGMVLGFLLLIFPYIKGGMGAGDVKALAALGTWLGLLRTFSLFIYMAMAGGMIIVGFLAWRGLLWAKIRQGWVALLNWILSRPHGPGPISSPTPPTPGIPYGVALAVGMAILCWWGPLRLPGMHL
jgi:prepilin peptidase CpaA